MAANVLAAAIQSMDQFAIGASWGGTKSIVAVLDRPPLRTATATPHDGPLVRLSIGLENVEDLLASLLPALDMIAADSKLPTSSPSQKNGAAQ